MRAMNLPPPLGEPVDPPWSEVQKKWDAACRSREPRTFLQLFDAREGRTVRTAGLHLLGYEDGREFNTAQLLQLTHENQRMLLHYQTSMVYRVFAERPELIYGKDVVYCNIRSFMDAAGQFWRVHQVSVPAQYDQICRLVRYLSYYRILGKYNGEPFETDIYTSPKFPEEGRLLMLELKRIKDEALQGLGFTQKEEDVIRLMAANCSRAAIAETMNITPRTVDKHRLNILEKGRLFFPLNDFSQAADVVRYLDRQWLL